MAHYMTSNACSILDGRHYFTPTFSKPKYHLSGLVLTPSFHDDLITILQKGVDQVRRHGFEPGVREVTLEKTSQTDFLPVGVCALKSVVKLVTCHALFG